MHHGKSGVGKGAIAAELLSFATYITLSILLYGGRIKHIIKNLRVSIKDENNYLHSKFHWLLLVYFLQI